MRGRAAREQAESLAPQILHGRAMTAREDQLHAIASGEIGQLVELEPPREVLKLLRSAALRERELRERFAAALAPRHADEAKMFEHVASCLNEIGCSA